MNMARILSVAEGSEDQRNFKIKPFPTIFAPQMDQNLDKKEDKGYPPPVFPKLNGEE